MIDCSPGAAALYIAATHLAAAATAGQIEAWRARPWLAPPRELRLYLETADSPTPGAWAGDATPLPRTEIAVRLRRGRVPVRAASLLCDPADLPELARAFFAAGAVQIDHLDASSEDLSRLRWPERPAGLRRYVRRTSLAGGGSLRGLSRLSQLEPRRPVEPRPSGLPVTAKEIFDSGAERYGEVFLTTGGSTGEPALASYTYDSFSIHTRAGGEAMYAAGLDPLRDRVMNLFTAGGLYSGFIGFFKALESVGVRQFPMASLPNLELVSRAIVEHRVNVLVGLPPYLLQLFKAHDPLFTEYRGIEKIFYSGDHFDPGQAQYLKDRYGVKVILSGHYGSIDAGSFGFQCAHCEGTTMHLHDHLQRLEILDPEADRPVPRGEVGRLIFSSRVHSPESMQRYDTGDLGRWIDGACPCGRATPRFELLGRLSDWFKAGTFFMNYWRIVNGVRRETGYVGNTQVRLTSAHGRDLVTVVLAADGPFDAESARAAVFRAYPELADKVQVRQVFDFAVELVPEEGFVRSRSSGKIRHVLDLRRTIPGFEP
jgi:phenylacetate-coenzyme A ligase PaaK-like adenylate-forming protein